MLSADVQGPEALDESLFEARVLGAPGPVLVDVTAAWCVPCQRLGAVLPKLAREWRGQVAVYTLDADAYEALRHQWDVRSFPQVLVFDGGALRGRVTGFEGYGRFRSAVETQLAACRVPEAWPGEAAFALRAAAAEQAYEDATVPAAEAVGRVLEPYFAAYEAEQAQLQRQEAAGTMTAQACRARVAALNAELRDRAAPELAAQRAVTATALAAYRQALQDATVQFFGLAEAGIAETGSAPGAAACEAGVCSWPRPGGG